MTNMVNKHPDSFNTLKLVKYTPKFNTINRQINTQIQHIKTGKYTFRFSTTTKTVYEYNDLTPRQQNQYNKHEDSTQQNSSFNTTELENNQTPRLNTTKTLVDEYLDSTQQNW